MKKVLFVYPQMMLGGSTTSLLSILEEIDQEKYDVDLLLLYNNGPYEPYIPQNIRVLPYGHLIQNNILRKIYKIVNFKYLAATLCGKQLAKKHNNPKVALQYLSSADVDWFRRFETVYDVAVGFLEGYSNKYVAKHINAKRKIAWIHINYEDAGFVPEYDHECFTKMDKIVAVSDDCSNALCRCFPSFSDKIAVVNNILSARRIQRMALEKVEDFKDHLNKINIVTTCRIAFDSKGLDRAVRTMAKLRDARSEQFKALAWFIIGDGPDKDDLEQLINEYQLSNSIHLLGLKLNPYPYLKKMDLFFLPSLWEGKPMAVTEAQILGLPALVTRYTSAPEQIRNGIDGMIVENSEQGVYEGLQYVLMHSEEIEKWRRETAATRYDNPEEIKAVEDLIDGRD